jgi:hypothetical protein
LNLRVQLVLVLKAQLPFTSQIKAPCDLIYSDLWGLSPVCSRTGHKYYISFLDAYNRYTWLFPITFKNDALPIFIQFQKYVQWYFNFKIKSIQSDVGGGGGEFRSLSKFFLELWYSSSSFLSSYTPTKWCG